MKKTFVRAAFAAALMCSSAGVMMTVAPSIALAEGEKVSRDVGKPLVEAIKAAQGNDFKTALDKIHEAQAVADKTPYDEYKINEILGFIAINTKDFATADTAYEAMADSVALPADATKSTLHNAILLAGQEKHWPKVTSYCKRLEALGGMDEKTYAVMAQAYYFTNDFANAQASAQKSVDAAKAAGKEPDQAALEIIMSAQSKSSNQAGAEQTLEQLAISYGAPDSWGNLTDIALGTKGMTELDALFIYRLRFFSGATSRPDDYADAAGIALQKGYPTEAENLLEKGFANGLGRSGRAAEELPKARSGARLDEASLTSIAAAAEKAKAGEQDVKMAEDYWGYGRYADAAAAAARGVAKGGIKDAGEGQLILAISLVAQGKYGEGREALAKVDGSAARAKAAHLWDLYAQFKSKPAAAAAAAPAQH